VLLSKLIRAPRPVMMLIIDRMSAMSGTFVSVVFSFESSAAHIIGSTAFFDPDIWICPFRGRPPLTINFAIGFFWIMWCK